MAALRSPEPGHRSRTDRGAASLLRGVGSRGHRGRFATTMRCSAPPQRCPLLVDEPGGCPRTAHQADSTRDRSTRRNFQQTRRVRTDRTAYLVRLTGRVSELRSMPALHRWCGWSPTSSDSANGQRSAVPDTRDAGSGSQAASATTLADAGRRQAADDLAPVQGRTVSESIDRGSTSAAGPLKGVITSEMALRTLASRTAHACYS